MRKPFILLFSILLCLFFACSGPQQAQEEPENYDGPVGLVAFFEQYKGYYVGDFFAKTFKEDGTYNNKITMVIDSLDAGTIYGRSIVAGNIRPFVGTLDLQAMRAIAEEPGDDRYDGVFQFQLTEDIRIKGDWRANDTELNVTHRIFDLEKRDFSYDKSLQLPGSILLLEQPIAISKRAIELNPSKRLLKESEAENLLRGDKRILIASIYARHGLSFKERDIRYIFDRVKWHIPVSIDVEGDLTDIEKQNIARLEK